MKGDMLVLTGVAGTKAYNHICNAKPLKKPLYTKEDSDRFEKLLAPHISQIIKEMENAEY